MPGVAARSLFDVLVGNGTCRTTGGSRRSFSPHRTFPPAIGSRTAPRPAQGFRGAGRAVSVGPVPPDLRQVCSPRFAAQRIYPESRGGPNTALSAARSPFKESCPADSLNRLVDHSSSQWFGPHTATPSNWSDCQRPEQQLSGGIRTHWGTAPSRLAPNTWAGPKPGRGWIGP